MGTTWNDPPILENPSETIEIDGRDYDLYYDGDRLRLVAWHDATTTPTGSATPCCSTLDEADMLAHRQIDGRGAQD